MRRRGAFAARVAVLTAIAASITGCFTAVPVTGVGVALGTPIVLTITDQGRVAYSEQLGASVEAVEGRLLQRDSAGYTLAVSQLALLRGGTQVWSGERVRIKTEHVSAVAERRLAKGRTAFLSASAIGAVVLIARSSLAGALFGEEGTKPTDPAVSSRMLRY